MITLATGGDILFNILSQVLPPEMGPNHCQGLVYARVIEPTSWIEQARLMTQVEYLMDRRVQDEYPIPGTVRRWWFDLVGLSDLLQLSDG